MYTLHIEWKHFEKHGDTCQRCATTGKTLTRVIQTLKEPLAQQGISILYTETKLDAEHINESNALLFNGVPLESILPTVHVSAKYCETCSTLAEHEVCCRTVEYQDAAYEEIPEILIRSAINKAIQQIGALPTPGEAR